MNPRIHLVHIADRVIVSCKAHELSSRLAEIAAMYGPQDIFDNAPNYTPGLSREKANG